MWQNVGGSDMDGEVGGMENDVLFSGCLPFKIESTLASKPGNGLWERESDTEWVEVIDLF